MEFIMYNIYICVTQYNTHIFINNIYRSIKSYKMLFSKQNNYISIYLGAME